MTTADGAVKPGWYLLPLRLVLGVTFLYAGLQKLANPNFLRSSSPISIHAQLVGATHNSPIHGLISHLVPIASTLGVIIAIGEVAIGLGVLVGLWMRVAAVAGIALSFGLFLTVSFHSSPYFTGSDIVFVFAWTPLALAGAAGAPALDTWMAEQRAQRGTARAGDATLSRRSVAITGVAAAVALVVAGLAAVFGRAAGGVTAASGTTTPTLGGSGTTTPSTQPATTQPTTATTAGPGVTTTTSSAPPAGTAIGSATSVPVGGSAAFTDPASGDPALVIQHTADQFVAFNAICPHAGCTVAYLASSDIIGCPCHGSEFDAKTGAVIQGPASNGLTKISIIKGANGKLYVPK